MSYHAEADHTPSKPTNTIHIDFSKKALDADLTVFYFEDNGYVINYVPALNLTAYGATLDEAKEMLMQVVLEDYFDALLALPRAAAHEELSKLGWVIINREMSDFKNSAYVDKEGILRNFNLPQDTVIQEEVLSVA